MGRKERRAREEKRENYATKHTAEKRKNMMIAIGILGIIAAIVVYAVWVYATTPGTAPGGPPNAGSIGSAHAHAAILVKIFNDEFDFSTPAYQIKSNWIHFEGRDGTTVHKHATGVTLGYLFETLSLGVDEDCFVFQDRREFCTSDEYDLKFFINGEERSGITDYEIFEDDRILISYGATPEQLESHMLQLENQILVK